MVWHGVAIYWVWPNAQHVGRDKPSIEHHVTLTIPALAGSIRPSEETSNELRILHSYKVL